ncbi:CRISPR-associated helicase Cas3' [Oligosphaera ethanolica]|uniref:CRISPR-associated endonuclease/helicase Cas3 n=1 Tax=Oligosphaera ethanolica TaxID=760260 RepID=A0AAE4AMA0_9BACT|nr:CRISPR-associated helicase Cas3' [Oligosphaera ethanolica]MDQ0288266.1 CRISPR-associated endonuclease/helicase Cas3 [Oligosphaera ethanolica]
MAFNFQSYAQKSQQPPIAVQPLADCLAKTIRRPDGSQHMGCTVEAHLQAVCYVLRELKKSFAHTSLVDFLPPIAEWLAALHDIGKLTPVFQEKIYAALGIKKNFGVSYPFEKENHGLSTQLVLRRRFGDRFSQVAAAHHGFGFLSTTFHSEDSQWLGGAEWDTLRDQMITNLENELALPAFDPDQLDEQTISAVLGAVILADWLGSSMEIPYGVQPTPEWAARTVAEAGFRPCEVRQGLRFEDVFPFSPNALQDRLLREIHPGACYVIEAEMGCGKTEAALFVAYKLLEDHSATGIYFALPTQLTSEKIHVRMDDFLSKIISDSTRKESLLIHGEAWLNWSTYCDNEDGVATAKPDSWFYAPKRALLAPFAVGTVDQALMSVINVRHRDLRAFGLAGKVVIIDEIHSYDTYTGTLINELVRHLKDWGCTVIILSATLSAAAQKKLIGSPNSGSTTIPQAYPLVSVQDSIGQRLSIPINPLCRKSVKIINSTDELACINEALCAAAGGQQVLWIENTVQNAQRLYQTLSGAAVGTTIEIGLIHSRYPHEARAANESRWVSMYGKDGSQERSLRGRILLGTQILEQSIDIDADFLITRLAPSDMLLQRIGRLWRHGSLLQRPKDAQCKTIVLHTAFFDPAVDLYVSRYDDLPYERYVMVRSQEIWWQKETIQIPEDIRPIIEGTYAERLEQGSISKLKAELDNRVRSMRQQALVSASSTMNVMDDDAARTRLNDQPQIRLLLIAKNNHGDDLSDKIWMPFSDAPVILPLPQATIEEKKAVLKKLYAQMIKTSEYCAPSYDSFTLDEALGSLMYLGDRNFRPIRAAYLDHSGFLLDKASNYSGHKGVRLKYGKKLGLQTVRDEP